MGAASVLVLTAALASGGSGKAARFAGLAVSRVDLVQESGSLPEVARRLVDITVGDLYDPAAVQRSIKQLFALGSFSDIKVEAQAEAQGVALTFRLYPVLKVEEVLFLGLDDGPGSVKDLRKEIVKERGLRPGTVLVTERVEAAVEKIDRWLAQEGFFWVRTEPEVRFQTPGARILFHIEKGPLARLSSFRVDGVPLHIEQDVRRRIAISPGDPYIPSAVRKRIDKLVAQWKTKGYYEARVDIQEAFEPPDRVDVDIDVEMGRRILIQVEGASVSDRTLNGLVPVVKEQSTSEDLIEESRANVELHFKRQGYRDAVTTVKRTTYGSGQYLLLAFHVELGTRVRVGEVRVEGLSTLADKQIAAVMATGVGRFRATPFRSRVWEDDLEAIRLHLLRQGFHRASVYGEVHEATGEPDVVDLVVHVDEGPRATIAEIQVDGVEEVDPSEALLEAGLDVGSSYYPPRVVEAREHLYSALLNRGYQQAEVDVRSQLDETGTRASLKFVIHEGPQTFVDRVIVSGLDVTREDALRQQVAVSPKEPLSADGLLETRQQLVGTGLFRVVSVEALPRDASSESSDVLIRVEEGPRTTFGYGVGYNELDLARVDGEITRRNIFGRNRTASVFARASVKGGRFVLTYRQPEFVGLDVPVFVSAIYEQGERPSFNFIQKSLGFQVTKKHSERRTYFFRYNFQQTRVFELKIDPEELPREFRNIRLSTVSASQVTDTRDDPINPTNGQFRLLNLELSAKFLGTKSPYLKGLAQQFFYFPLPYRMVGVVGLRLGIGQTFREDRDALMPITERFFAGGANTLRGFGLDEASPKDAEGNPVGGNVLTLANLELRFPIAGNLGGVFFSDNGAVYRRLNVIEPLSWRYNLGFGFRYETPLGPLRVDMGFKLDRRLTPEDGQLVREPLSRIHVSLGHAF